MLLSNVTYKSGQCKQSKSTKEQWYVSAITSLGCNADKKKELKKETLTFNIYSLHA